MAFLEQMKRQVGEPRQPEVPGAPPRPSMPAQNVNPPAPATGIVGRPSLSGPTFATGFAGGTGQPLPIQPGAASAPQRPSMPATGSAGGMGPTGGMKAAGGGTSGAKSELWPNISAGPGEATPTAVKPVFQIGHVPTATELATMPDGFQIMTPYGEVQKDGSLIPSPEGAVKYQQAIVQARKQFGPHPWADDPQAPPPPVRLGRSMINPFTGQWTQAKG